MDELRLKLPDTTWLPVVFGSHNSPKMKVQTESNRLHWSSYSEHDQNEIWPFFMSLAGPSLRSLKNFMSPNITSNHFTLSGSKTIHCPLVNIQKATENGHGNSWFTHSIAFCMFTRGYTQYFGAMNHLCHPSFFTEGTRWGPGYRLIDFMITSPLNHRTHQVMYVNLEIMGCLTWKWVTKTHPYIFRFNLQWMFQKAKLEVPTIYSIRSM